MDRSERAVVAGVHCLEHVECFRATNLTYDDPVRSHPKAVTHELALADFSTAFDVGWPSLQAHHMRLTKLQLRGVFDRDDTLVFRNKAGQDVEHRGLTSASAT
jgi:hypothetical protein